MFGSLTSPNYPSFYPNSLNCSTVLDINSPNQMVYIQILALNSECGYDYLTISNRYGQILYSNCYQQGVYAIIDYAPITVSFTADFMVNGAGFNLTYFFCGPENCGSTGPTAFPPINDNQGQVTNFPPTQPDYVFTSETPNNNNTIIDCSRIIIDSQIPGVVSSPNFPGPYSNGLNCVTVLQSSNPQELVAVTITTLIAETNWDFLTITDKDGNQLFRASTLFGSMTFINYTPLTITFTTDSSVVMSGFQFVYAFLDAVSQVQGPAILSN